VSWIEVITLVFESEAKSSLIPCDLLFSDGCGPEFFICQAIASYSHLPKLFKFLIHLIRPTSLNAK